MLWFGRKPKDVDPYFDRADRLAALTSGDEPFTLVDVRSQEEWDAGTIPGAIHIPYLEIDARPPTDDKDELIIVFCHSGARSETARRMLLKKGYRRVHNFGGIIHWPGELTGDRGGTQ